MVQKAVIKKRSDRHNFENTEEAQSKRKVKSGVQRKSGQKSETDKVKKIKTRRKEAQQRWHKREQKKEVHSRR